MTMGNELQLEAFLGHDAKRKVAMRPQIVGLALKKISQDPDIAHAVCNVLETQNIIDGQANITLIPRNSELLGQLVAATQMPKAATAK